MWARKKLRRLTYPHKAFIVTTSTHRHDVVCGFYRQTQLGPFSLFSLEASCTTALAGGKAPKPFFKGDGTPYIVITPSAVFPVEREGVAAVPAGHPVMRHHCPVRGRNLAGVRRGRCVSRAHLLYFAAGHRSLSLLRASPSTLRLGFRLKTMGRSTTPQRELCLHGSAAHAHVDVKFTSHGQAWNDG